MRTAGILLVTALAVFMACGIGMMCFEYLVHYALLTDGVPVEPLIASVIFLVLLVVIAPPDKSLATATALFLGYSKDSPAIPRPLQLVFSDGILNSKAF